MVQRQVIVRDAGHQLLDELDATDIPALAYDASGAAATAASGAASALSTHAGAADPHTVYALESALGTLATQSGTFSGTSSGTNTGDQTLPTDATIATTDVTTNNVSTTKHGWAPKLPNDATKYMDGTGAYTVPPGGSGAPTDATYLTTAAHAGLSAEVVVPAAVLSVLDDTTVAAMVDTLGGASSTGTGGLVRATSPALVTPALGTPASGVATNLTGTAAGLTAGNVTTNANLTGPVTSVGNATTIASVTKRVPIALDTPDASGNGYPALSTNNGFSNVRRVVPAFTKDVLGTWEGAVRIPADYASAGKVVISLVANATANVFRSIVSTSVVAANATEDPAYTDETAVDTTFATTAKRRVDVSFTLTTTPVANSTLNVKVTHDGAHANDTLAVDCLLWEVLFEYST